MNYIADIVNNLQAIGKSRTKIYGLNSSTTPLKSKKEVVDLDYLAFYCREEYWTLDK